MVKRCPTPPMGWNSYDGYLGAISEAQFRENVEYIAANLKPFGYEYAVIDAGWYNNTPKILAERQNLETFDELKATKPEYNCDQFGRPVPHPDAFPCTAEAKSFKPLADYVHSKGLKFGLHMMRGMTTNAFGRGCIIKGTDTKYEDLIDLESLCLWSPKTFGVKTDHPSAQEWYDSLFEMFAEWEIDFVKYDDLGSPIRRAEITMIHNAIDKCGREILFSLSPGDFTKIEDHEFYSEHASMWRISRDFWDNWDDLDLSFKLLGDWNQYINDPGWPDGDMLPIGHLCEVPSERGIRPRKTRFNLDELRSLMTLFCFARSPLILTCNLSKNDAELLSVQTNKELIAINQRGEGNKVISRKDGQHLWRSKVDGIDYLALFYIGDEETNHTYEIPADLRGKTAEDVWCGGCIGKLGETLMLPITAHGCTVLRIK